MQEELFVIRDLWKLDREADAAQQDVRQMVQAVHETTAEIVAAREGLAAAEAALEEAKAAERKTNRQLEEYTQRRDRTKKMIDEGQVSDFLVAERQYKQCADIVDDLETQLLELIDAREKAEAAAAAQQARLQKARDADAAARDRHKERSPGLKARLAELQGKRPALWEKVSSEHRRNYEDLRQHKREVLTHLVGNTCAICNMSSPPQIAIEVAHGTRIHTCRGCGRFFFDAADAGERAE